MVWKPSFVATPPSSPRFSLERSTLGFSKIFPKFLVNLTSSFNNLHANLPNILLKIFQKRLHHLSSVFSKGLRIFQTMTLPEFSYNVLLITLNFSLYFHVKFSNIHVCCSSSIFFCFPIQRKEIRCEFLHSPFFDFNGSLNISPWLNKLTPEWQPGSWIRQKIGICLEPQNHDIAYSIVSLLKLF